MNKFNKWLAATVVLTTMVSPTGAIASTSFADLGQADTWAQDAIVKTQSLGYFTGDTSGNFHPHDSISRQELAVVLTRIMHLDVPNTATSSFSDVTSDTWGRTYIEAVQNAGLMVGDGNGHFRPTDAITREELASVLVKAAKLSVDGKGQHLSVVDQDSVSNWAKDDVQAAIESGLMKGDGVHFNPKNHATRQEIAMVALNFTEFLAKQNQPQVVQSVSDQGVVINDVTYQVSDHVKGIMSKANAAVLQGAKVKFEADGTTVNKITYLELTSSGQAAAAGQDEFSGDLVLDGNNAMIDGDLKLAADYISLNNLTVGGNLVIGTELQNDFSSNNLKVVGKTEVDGGAPNTVVFDNDELGTMDINKQNVRVEPKGSTTVGDLTVNSNATITADSGVTIPKLTVADGAENVEINAKVTTVDLTGGSNTTITGNGNIGTVQVSGGGNVTIHNTGTIGSLQVTNSSSKLTLAPGTKIDNLVLPEGTKPSDVIENYDQVKGQISNINGTQNPDVPAAGGGGGAGGGNVPPPIDQAAQTVKNEIAALPAKEAVTLDDKSAVAKARADYDALSATEKTQVGSITKLTDAEAAIEALETANVSTAEQLQTALSNQSINKINLAAGTYVGQFEVKRNVELMGQEGTIIQSPDELQMNGSNSSILLIDNGATAKIENLVIDGAGKGEDGKRFAGISFENAGGEVNNVTVQDIKNGTALDGMQEGFGIYAENSDGATRTLTVTNSNVSGYQKDGMLFKGAGLTVNVSGNTVTGAGLTKVIAQNGIQLSDGATGTITNNTVSENQCDPTTGWSATGILAWNAGAGFTIKPNNSHDNDYNEYANVPIGDHDMTATVTPTGGAGISNGHTMLAVAGLATGHKLYASSTGESAATSPNEGDKYTDVQSSYSLEVTNGTAEIPVSVGQHLSVIEVDGDGNVVAYKDYVISADEMGTKVIVMNGTELAAAVADANNAGKTIVFGDNIELTAPLTIAQPMTLDGNGHVINQAIKVAAAQVTIKDVVITPTSVENAVCGIYVATPTGTVIDQVTVGGNDAGYGVLTENGTTLTVRNSILSHLAAGIYLNPNSVLTATNNTIRYVVAGFGTDTSDLTGDISGNNFSNYTSDGIGMSNPILTGTTQADLKAKLLVHNTFDNTDKAVNFYN